MKNAKEIVTATENRFTYTWSYANQEEVTEELDPYWLAVLEELDTEADNNRRKQHRHQCTLEGLDFEGEAFMAEGTDPEVLLLEKVEERAHEEQLRRLAEYRQRLPRRHQELLNALYNDEEPMTQQEYAEALGINQSNISRQQNTALRKLGAFFLADENE